MHSDDKEYVFGGSELDFAEEEVCEPYSEEEEDYESEPSERLPE